MKKHRRRRTNKHPDTAVIVVLEMLYKALQKHPIGSKQHQITLNTLRALSHWVDER